jgi:DNA-directed RNA polymerase subunit RPC12/RpoP
MVERPPRSVEYICLSCGVQGLMPLPKYEEAEMQGDNSLICPKCGGSVLCIEREVALCVSMPVLAAKP